MTEAELARLNERTHGLIGPDDLGDRTLLYGYDIERNIWHVYQKDGQIHILVFCHEYDKSRSQVVLKRYKKDVEFFGKDLAPNKRLYPDRCDFAFCEILMTKGVFLPFTTFDADMERRKRTPFVSLMIEDFSDEHRSKVESAMTRARV